MRTKAAAYQEYNQAAVLDKVITNLPEVVKAIAEPLAKVDKISIVSTGGANGSSLGASRVTGDVVNMLAQVPAILEALTGTKFSDLMARVPGLTTVDGTASASSEANGNGISENGTQPKAQNTQPASNTESSVAGKAEGSVGSDENRDSTTKSLAAAIDNAGKAGAAPVPNLANNVAPGGGRVSGPRRQVCR